QLALAREKNLRLAKLAAAAMLAVSLLGSGIWYGVRTLGFKSTHPDQANSAPPAGATTQPPVEPTPQPTRPTQPAEDPEVARLLESSRRLLREKKFPESEKAAKELLARSPNHSEGVRIQREAEQGQQRIEEGLKQARLMFDRKKYTEVASVLSGVL